MNRLTAKVCKGLLLTGLCSLLLAGSALAAENELAIGAAHTTGEGLRLREEASTSANIITTLDKDWTLAILDESIEGWFKVAYEGKTGYVSGEFVQVDTDNVFNSYGWVNADNVNVRSQPTTDSGIVTTASSGTVVNVTGLTEDGWYSVSCKSGAQGYIRSDFLDLSNSDSASVESTSSGNASIVSTAKNYLGVHYVYGGASPSGFDCSGFTMYVYAKHGYSLPHTASGQWQSGMGTRTTSIGALQVGDLVFFNDPSRNAGKACSHAGIYVGGGQFIHASSSRGVIISDLTSGYYNNYFVGGIHV